MNNLVECKTTINSSQAKISNLNDELLEHEKELQNATAKIEELVSIQIFTVILRTYIRTYNGSCLYIDFSCVY